MAELEANPEFQRRMAEKARQRKEEEVEINRELDPILARLHSVGLIDETLQEVVERYCPLSHDIVEVLLESLLVLKHPRVIESVVRALAAAKEPFDGRPLAFCFETTDDHAVKWCIANTITFSHPHSIDDWVQVIRKNKFWDETFRKLGIDQKSSR